MESLTRYEGSFRPDYIIEAVHGSSSLNGCPHWVCGMNGRVCGGGILHALHSSGCLKGNARPLSIAAIFTSDSFTTLQPSCQDIRYYTSNDNTDTMFSFPLAKGLPGSEPLVSWRARQWRIFTRFDLALVCC